LFEALTKVYENYLISVLSFYSTLVTGRTKDVMMLQKMLFYKAM